MAGTEELQGWGRRRGGRGRRLGGPAAPCPLSFLVPDDVSRGTDIISNPCEDLEM